MNNEQTTSGAKKFLIVHVRSSCFLVSLSGVSKIVPARNFSRDDFLPDGFIATTEVDGEIFPIIDLGARFAEPASTRTQGPACLLLLAASKTPIALMVDAIGTVESLLPSDIDHTGVLENEGKGFACLGFARIGEESL